MVSSYVGFSVDQVLKQATRVKNSLCLSRDYDGVFRAQMMTNMIFIVKLDMVMKESLVISFSSNEGK